MPSRDARAGAGHRASPGPGGRPPIGVAEIQRQRLLAAMAEVAAERGAANASVAHVVSRAGVSRRTFYELFADREECFLAAFDQAVERAAASVVPAYRGQARWRERVRAGLAALLGFLAAEPRMGRLVVVEALGAGPRALEHRARVLAALIAAVDEGGAEVRGKDPPPLTAEGVVGAVFAIVHARLLTADTGGTRSDTGSTRATPGPLTDLLGELMGVIVLPYLGQAAAQKELHRPTPQLKTKDERPWRNPLEGLNMRLTYRTLRVLAEIARRPGASNRQVALAAEIADQGQMSKLLARLQELGLIENGGDGHAKGARNAWTLTARGEQVDRAIDPG